MITRKKPEVSLKAKYSKVIRVSLILALILNITVIYSVPRQKAEKKEIEQPNVKIENVEIPETQQYEKPPAPSRPSVPIASERKLAKGLSIAGIVANIPSLASGFSVSFQ